MSDIHVIFPKKKAEDPQEIIVSNPATLAPRGEPITWCFHSASSDIKSVEVAFEDADAEFFGNLMDNKTSLRVDIEEGQVDFYGHVPLYGTLREPKIAKYTIRAYNQKKADGGTVIAELDPVIITSKP